MSYPDEEKRADANEVFCGILGAVWFIATIGLTAIVIYSFIC